MLASQAAWELPSTAAIRQACEKLDLSLIGPPLVPPLSNAEYRRVFAAMLQDAPDAMIVNDQPEHLAFGKLIVDLAQGAALPMLSAWREHAEFGGLMSDGLDRLEMYRRLAATIAQVLDGTKPADIPFYRATKFELVIHLKSANALGLTIPPTLLAS